MYSMKKIILFELILLFLATTFESNNPPGWFQQTLPVNDIVNDLFFVDSLTGWIVTDGNPQSNDTGFIMKTTNGGNNWTIQYNQPMKFNVVQMLNSNTGYAAGGFGFGKVFKTTNSGTNWIEMPSPGLSLEDMAFVNKDTGWVCDNASIGGGLWRTTNGGNNWQQQLGASFFPFRLFFLNKDTGWVITSDNKIYKTLNSGFNWSLQVNFLSEDLVDVWFTNALTGWIHGGPTGIYKSTNGGVSWDTVTNPLGYGTGKIFFINQNRGWIGRAFNTMLVTRDGQTWGYQNTPAFTNFSVFFIDTAKGWAGTSILIHTTDGGGPTVGVQQIENELPFEYKLFQNYPNPFNPNTIIRFQIKRLSDVKIVVYDIQGRQIKELVNLKQNAGTYEVDFDGSAFSSGIYFYSLIVDGKLRDSKKMILVK